MAKKSPQPEQLEHDTFEDFSLKLTAWLAKNRTILAVAFVALAAAVGVAIVVRVNSQNQREAQSQKFLIAVHALQAAIGQQDLTERVAQLKDARTQFQDFADAQSGVLGDLALYFVGNTWYYDDLQVGEPGKMGSNYERAAEVYDALTRRATDPIQRALGFYSKGYSFESLGFLGGSEANARLNEALTAYEEAEKLAKGTWLDFESKLARARIYTAREGEEAKARALLTQIIADRKTAPSEAGVIEERAYNRLSEDDRAILAQISSQITTFGIARTAELMLERLGAETPKS